MEQEDHPSTWTAEKMMEVDPFSEALRRCQEALKLALENDGAMNNVEAKVLRDLLEKVRAA